MKWTDVIAWLALLGAAALVVLLTIYLYSMPS